MSMNLFTSLGLSRFDRRTLLRHSLFGAGAMAYGPVSTSLASPAMAAPETSPVVETAAGKLRGVSVNGIKTFRGIPYGGPTEGAGRFMAPQKPKPWVGVRDALRNGPICTQVSGLPHDVLFDEIEGRSDMSFMSENCLTLNVWSPGTDGAKRPVMVWLHGGSFIVGSALEPRYDGRNLARNGDVVVVGVNHRLGPFGYLYLEHLSKKYVHSGDAGVLDLVLALEWVRDNVAAFGGDPGNVTIFGQSGGGAKVCTVLTMPAAKGLVHKAIIQSGANMRAKLPEDAIEDTSLILNELGIAPNQVDKLQSLPAFRLIGAYQAIGDRNGGIFNGFVGSSIADMERSYARKVPRFAPVLDPSVLPAHPFDPATPGMTADVPVVIGTTKDETEQSAVNAPELYKVANEEELRAKIRLTAGEKGEALAGLYRRKYPKASLQDTLIAVASEMRRTASIALAESKIAHMKTPVFMYRLDWESPTVYKGRRLRAAHSMELSLVFDTVDLYPGPTGGGPSARALAGKMSRSWSGFARSASPDAPGMPHWPPYTIDTRATMVFDDECKVVNDLDREERLLGKELAQPRRP